MYIMSGMMMAEEEDKAERGQWDGGKQLYQGTLQNELL